MKRKICHEIRLAAFVSSVFLVSACATAKPELTAGDKTDAIARETTRKVGSKTEQSITGSSNRTESAKPVVQIKTSAQTATDKSGNRQNIGARVLQKVKLVNIRSVASGKARIIARLQGGKQIEILQEKGSWLKIRWQDGEKAREGWLHNRYVEMTP